MAVTSSTSPDAEAGPGSVRRRKSLDFSNEVLLTDTVAIARLIEPAVKGLGFRLVRVAMIGGTSDPTLQVMAELPDTRQLTIDDCTDISRKLSELLDAEEAAGRDPIEGGYRLEVSSPGIDRPLTRLKDYADWAGYEARITLRESSEGRKQYSGTLAGIEDDHVALTDKSGRAHAFPFADIPAAALQ